VETSTGLINNGGLLNMANRTISGNSDCGISSAYFDPQFDRRSSGQPNISNSIVSSNTGCGMSTSYTRLGISDSTISNNGGNGGSVVVVDASSFATILSSTITRNAGSEGLGNVPPSAKVGGGVYAGLKSGASILNSTISDNSEDGGAGLYVSINRGSAGVTNSTITGKAVADLLLTISN
jgi:hypothetical protein